MFLPSDGMIEAALSAAEGRGLLLGRNATHEILTAAMNYAPIDERLFMARVVDELHRARAKHPGDNATLAALTEEVGEVSQALLDERASQVMHEAVQVAAMAMRLVLDGDYWMNMYRASRGLEPVGGGK